MSHDPLQRIHNISGGRLAPLAIEWGTRPDVPPPIQITARDVEILALIHDVGTLSASMLEVLFWGRAAARGPKVQSSARMKLLHDVGMLDRFRPRSTREQGSHEYIYRLATPGWQVLRRARRAADGDDYTPAALTNISYAEHDVDVSALIVALAARCAHGLGPLAPLKATVGFDWLGERRGTVDPRLSVPVGERHPAARLGELQLHPERSIPGYIKPDATLTGLAADNQQPYAVMFEYDRTRRPTKQLNGRLLRYDRFLLEGWRSSQHATGPDEPAVLLVCDAEPQLHSFVAVADGELTAYTTQPGNPRPYYPGREHIAFTSYPRLMTGDWRMLQVPDRPPTDTRRLSSAPRAIELPLDRLFATPALPAAADTAAA